MGRRSTVTTRDHSGRWGELLTMTRLLAAALAVLLLAVHHVTDHDGALVAVTVAWTAVSLGALRLPRVQRSAVAWLVDAAVALALIWASGDWRSAFYLYAITTLVLPATSLRFRGAVLWGLGYIAAYLAVAVATERLDGGTLRSTARIETIATHLTVPLVVSSRSPTPSGCSTGWAPSASAASASRSRPSVSASRGSCTTPPSSACTRRTSS